MRKVLAPLGLILVFSVVGCADGGRMNLLRPNDKIPTPLPTTTPTKEQLVAYLNNNAEKIPSVEVKDVSLSANGIPVPARMFAQGPRNFRLMATVMGNSEVDLGSNNQEFWYWIRRADPPYQFFCSYQALEEGSVRQVPPFPFQPEWVLEAMGMGKYGPAEKYEMVTEAKHYKLIEHTKSPQGVPVKKIIVFDARNLSQHPDQPQVTDFLLVDERSGKQICSAKITRRQILPNKGELPRELKLSWPEQKMELVMRLNGVEMTQNFPAQVFVRTQTNAIQSYNLATGQIERVRQAGGVAPPGTPR